VVDGNTAHPAPGIEVNPGPARPATQWTSGKWAVRRLAGAPAAAAHIHQRGGGRRRRQAARASSRQNHPRQRRKSRPMISGVFIDRPRLAIVHRYPADAGRRPGLCCAFRSRSSPISFPPQVTVSTTFAGASAAVVEQTRPRSPWRRQSSGVDKMIYMKSKQRERRQLRPDRQLPAG